METAMLQMMVCTSQATASAVRSDLFLEAPEGHVPIQPLDFINGTALSCVAIVSVSQRAYKECPRRLEESNCIVRACVDLDPPLAQMRFSCCIELKSVRLH